MSQVHFCLKCGSPLSMIDYEGRLREVCPCCGWVNYAQLKVSAGVQLEENGKLFLVQRANEPWLGCWQMPAGYVEVDEDPAQAAERETREESGIIVSVGSLVDYYLYTDDPRGNGVVLIFDARKIGGKLTTSAETLQAGFYSPEEIHQMTLAGQTAHRSIQQWLAVNGSSLRSQID